MATQADVRRIALSLPGTEEAGERFAFSVRNKGKLKQYIWAWNERIDPKKPRVPNKKVIAVRVASMSDRDVMLSGGAVEVLHRAPLQRFPGGTGPAGRGEHGGAETATH